LLKTGYKGSFQVEEAVVNKVPFNFADNVKKIKKGERRQIS